MHTLHFITLRYVTLRYVMFRYVTLRYVTLHYITSHYIHTHTHTCIYIYIHARIEHFSNTLKCYVCAMCMRFVICYALFPTTRCLFPDIYIYIFLYVYAIKEMQKQKAEHMLLFPHTWCNHSIISTIPYNPQSRWQGHITTGPTGTAVPWWLLSNHGVGTMKWTLWFGPRRS